METEANGNRVKKRVKSMRRKDREVTDLQEIEEIIKGCKVCHLAMADAGQPYIVPLNFGYQLESQVSEM